MLAWVFFGNVYDPDMDDRRATLSKVNRVECLVTVPARAGVKYGHEQPEQGCSRPS